jgi:hypothetical protein
MRAFIAAVHLMRNKIKIDMIATILTSSWIEMKFSFEVKTDLEKFYYDS